MKGLLAGTDLIAIISFASCLHGTNQNIFRCMFHINEFQDLGIIPLPFQIFRPQSIRHKCSKTLFDQPTGFKTSLAI